MVADCFGRGEGEVDVHVRNGEDGELHSSLNGIQEELKLS